MIDERLIKIPKKKLPALPTTPLRLLLLLTLNIFPITSQGLNASKKETILNTSLKKIWLMIKTPCSESRAW